MRMPRKSETLAVAEAEPLAYTLADTLAKVKVMLSPRTCTTVDGVKGEALVDTLANAQEEAEGGAVGDVDDVDAEALVDTLANTQAKAKPTHWAIRRSRNLSTRWLRG